MNYIRQSINTLMNNEKRKLNIKSINSYFKSNYIDSSTLLNIEPQINNITNDNSISSSSSSPTTQNYNNNNNNNNNNNYNNYYYISSQTNHQPQNYYPLQQGHSRYSNITSLYRPQRHNSCPNINSPLLDDNIPSSSSPENINENYNINTNTNTNTNINRNRNINTNKINPEMNMNINRQY
ncbi:hypothetical protein BCR32DRAFT_265392 [Anaeromyces robustus]|uniref:Uncharacterized protein n=1 Tax=Anaeromyces robustus TaxID=1754192 RepID=A0A1Y1XJH4_9FUNG|nr:hypothetical protein BCR32DRAFT_265392 [Anaeromyces robustus]|eukprot:ORX85852.1 hypothetical protein BCR32DRAFT_265392 [Anaeromyces robustus]